ncbi:Nitrogen regulatory protein [Burkholderia glumae]|nr:Nitrogen regulatory protein [Burkholderia glumae]QTP34155.1 Nitrogen regulatory protein [Burkholderia glumae]
MCGLLPGGIGGAGLSCTQAAIGRRPRIFAVMEYPSTAARRPQAAPLPVNMNRLAKILPLENVVIDLSVTSKKRVFEQAGLIFENQNGIARSIVTDNLFARERLGSTGLGEGVAIPHGRIKGLKQPLAGFVRLAEPIPFEAPDGQPVSLLIFLLVPEQATQQHLEILSEIAQLLSDREARERLHTEPDRNELHQLLTQWQP